MNEHIRKANEALQAGDRDTAASEYYLALEDPNPIVQRIAGHRLMEIFPEKVYGSTHSHQRLYHRPNCSAKNVIEKRHIVWFRDWIDAESKGHKPCGQCRPSRTGSTAT